MSAFSAFSADDGGRTFHLARRRSKGRSLARREALDASAPATTKVSSKDLVIVHGKTADGQGLHVLRSRADRLEAGIMKPLESGKPLQGEVVKLTPRPECPLLFDAETQFSVQGALGAGGEGRTGPSGPAQVASDSYRKNWDAIWKPRPKKKSTELAN